MRAPGLYLFIHILGNQVAQDLTEIQPNLCSESTALPSQRNQVKLRGDRSSSHHLAKRGGLEWTLTSSRTVLHVLSPEFGNDRDSWGSCFYLGLTLTWSSGSCFATYAFVYERYRRVFPSRLQLPYRPFLMRVGKASPLALRVSRLLAAGTASPRPPELCGWANQTKPIQVI